MTDTLIGLSMRAKNYDALEGRSTTTDSPLTSQPNHSLTLDKPAFELPSHASKVTLHRTTHNFNTIATQHYSIVEDLAHAPRAMSSLDVLQSCHTQCKDLLSTISEVDPSNTNPIYFDSDNCEPCLPPLVTFMLTIGCLGRNI